jgi:uncharacterized protein (DUF3084 family)
MDIGLVLIAIVLMLGGVIATVGDRIGMKVGKSRLSLFKLRPRQTATVVSVLTGSVISATTLGLLLLTSEQLRKGLFEFEEVQSNLNEARQDLKEAQTAKSTVESDLETVSRQKKQADADLTKVITSLKSAVDREAETQERFKASQQRLEQVSSQANGLRGEIGRLQSERQDLIERQAAIRQQIASRDRDIAQRNRDLEKLNQTLAQRNQEIAQRGEELSRLETQQRFLQDEISRLEVEFLKLRSGSVAVSRNQTLALLITRPDSIAAARRDMDQALVEANRVALRAILPDAQNDFQVIFIAPEKVEQAANQIIDGQPYVVRIASLGNYIVGEPCVLNPQVPCVEVDLQVAVNRVVFEPGQVVAQISIDDRNPDAATLVEKFRLLLATAQVQASLEGIILDEPRVAGGLSEPVIQFLENVRNYGEPLEIQAVASQPIFTTGPLYLDLIAVADGKVLFRTNL